MDIIVWDKLLHICLNGLSLGSDGLKSFIVDCIKIGNKMGICSADGTFGKNHQSTCQRKMKRQTVNKRKQNTEYQRRQQRQNQINQQLSSLFS